jgi:hypothetical protein
VTGLRASFAGSDIPDRGGASMKANETRDENSKRIEILKSEVQNALACNRPYYWSWYRTVFDKTVPPDKARVNTPSL